MTARARPSSSAPTAGWARLLLEPRRRRRPGACRASSRASCARAGLAAADIDASELDDTVPGFVIGRQTTVRDALEPLLQAYAADAVESDDRLVFRKRGRAPVATIPADLLVPLDERTGESWRERRAQEVELPERVTVLYLDKDADYQQGSQSARRGRLRPWAP